MPGAWVAVALRRGSGCNGGCVLVQAYTAILRSPTEYESTPAVSSLMQSYFLKLLSRYRDFMEPDVEPSAGSATHQNHHHHHHNHQPSQAGPLHRPSVSHAEDDGGYLRWV